LPASVANNPWRIERIKHKLFIQYFSNHWTHPCPCSKTSSSEFNDTVVHGSPQIWSRKQKTDSKPSAWWYKTIKGQLFLYHIFQDDHGGRYDKKSSHKRTRTKTNGTLGIGGQDSNGNIVVYKVEEEVSDPVYYISNDWRLQQNKIPRRTNKDQSSSMRNQHDQDPRDSFSRSDSSSEPEDNGSNIRNYQVQSHEVTTPHPYQNIPSSYETSIK